MLKIFLINLLDVFIRTLHFQLGESVPVRINLIYNVLLLPFSQEVEFLEPWCATFKILYFTVSVLSF